MQKYILVRKQNIPITPEKAWDFFSRPENLNKITPAKMDFKILTDIKDLEMYPGMIIHYTVKPLLGIPLKWETEIKEIRGKEYFKDVQKNGPYEIWEHTHLFQEIPNGVEMTDIVEYVLPFGILGQIMNFIIIKKQLRTIFDYRSKAVKNLFGEYKSEENEK